MKDVFLCLLIATVYTASAVPVEQRLTENDVPRIIRFTDEAGSLNEINLDADIDNDAIEDASRPESNQYLLYTRQNPEQPQNLVINDAYSIRKSNFKRKNPTVVVVHGWLNSEESDINPTIRDAFLEKTETNVIVVDWKHLARANYVSAARGVPVVGSNIAKFLDFLTDVTGARLDSFHLVGFSLGAHIVGNAGRQLEGKIARITGLDPAGPLFGFNSNTLKSDDAMYVEAIHTDGDLLEGVGIGTNIGDVDFWPNGGKGQPGCLTPICSHNRAWRLFAATVSYNHLVGRQCANFVQLTIGICRGDKLDMGNGEVNKTGYGIYLVSTGRRYPY